MKKVDTIPILFITAGLSLAGMTLYEVARHWLWPGVSVWPSHGVTIFLVAGLVAVAVYIILRDRRGQLERLKKDFRHRAHVEENIREAEAEKDIVLNSIPEIVTYQDAELRILWTNRAGESFSRCSVDDMVGRTCQDVYHHASTRCADCPVRRALLKGTTEEGEVRLSDGAVWLIRAHAVRHHAGRVTGVVTVVSDITARRVTEERRRELEAKMLQAQKLESLGVLAGGIAHDFNNLLVGILGNADLALEEIVYGAPGRKSIENIKQSALRAADLTNQMLAYSGRGSFVVKPLEINSLVSGMSQLLTTTLSQKTQLRFDLGRNLPALEGDETQLRQVVMNLVSNAAAAMADTPGVIRLRTYRQTWSQSDLNKVQIGDHLSPGNYLVLEVKDSGCGMDEERMGKIFEPFFTTKFVGRGLGLAAVSGIVRSHGGGIRVTSKPGKGSTFRVLLPGDASRPQDDPIRPAPFSKGPEPATILVVDDEPGIRDVVRQMLECNGFSVVTAENGVIAIEKYRSQPEKIQAVIMDMAMPDLDGKAVYHRLRAIREDVKIILSSGYAGLDDASTAGLKLAGILLKPYKMEALIELLNKTLSSENETPVFPSIKIA